MTRVLPWTVPSRGFTGVLLQMVIMAMFGTRPVQALKVAVIRSVNLWAGVRTRVRGLCPVGLT